MRIARFSRPVALYDASVSAQTSEAIGESIFNMIDFEEVADVNVVKVIGANSYPDIPGLCDSN